MTRCFVKPFGTITRAKADNLEMVVWQLASRFAPCCIATWHLNKLFPIVAATSVYERVILLKDVIENNDGYRLFYLNGKHIEREEDIQILYRLTWRATPSEVNREVNNRRCSADFKILCGNKEKALVEGKLAKNSQLKRNLELSPANFCSGREQSDN